MTALLTPFGALGRAILSLLTSIGQVALFALQAVRQLLDRVRLVAGWFIVADQFKCRHSYRLT